MNGQKKLLRTEIYDEIWSSNAKVTAEKHGVDYVDLLAACHQANIPIPTPKYRLAMITGEDVTHLKVALPKSNTEYILVKEAWLTGANQPKPGLSLTKEQLAFLDDPAKEQRIVDAVAKARQKKSWPTPPEVKAYKASVKEWRSGDHEHDRYNQRYYYESEKPQAPKFIDELSKQGMRRMCQIMTRLVPIFQWIGEKVSDDLTITIGKDKVEYEIKEDQDKVPHQLTKDEKEALAQYERDKKSPFTWATRPRIRKYDHPYNGHLRIRFVVAGSHKRYLKEVGQLPLEQRLPEIIVAFYQTYLETKRVREKHEKEERERQREEEQRERRQRQAEEEKKRVAALINEAKDYQLAKVIRAYAAAKKDEADDAKQKWMQSIADWIDPLVSADDPYLEKRQHGDSDEQKAKYLGEDEEGHSSFDNLRYFYHGW